MQASSWWDRQDIVDTVVRSLNAVDRGDWDGYRSSFTPDAKVGYERQKTLMSVAQFLDEVRGIVGHYAMVLHYATNFEITVDGDRASCQTYVLSQNVARPGGREPLDACLIYRDQLQRVERGWRLTRRMIDVVSINGRSQKPQAHS
ncbi:MAG: nuclear transport factor 2 family protein [Steroidobacteraceae bacterium]